VKDFGVLLGTKIRFPSHVDAYCCSRVKKPGPICCITSPDTLVILCCALVRSEIELASVNWEFVTSTDSFKIERVQRKVADL
jgi:hypothetical protein